LRKKQDNLKPPRNFKEAMKALDSSAWAVTCISEFVGFKEQGVF
jgi:hypothetical protein